MTAAAKQPAAHTPGPWRYEAGTKTIRSVPANYWLATMDSWDGAIDNAANAARIVACVNACEGITDPEMFRAVSTALANERDALRAEVERLREALQEMVRVWEGPRERAAVGFAAAVVNARAALGGGK